MQFEGRTGGDPFDADDSNYALIQGQIKSSFIEGTSPYAPKAIKIYVYQPYIRIRHIKLNESSCISILSRIYPADSIYLFNGQILDLNKTFFDYKIKDGNKIVLIPLKMMKYNPKMVENWKKITSDKDGFEERINLNINNDSRRELARIKDIKFYKFELKTRKYEKLIKSHQRYCNMDYNTLNSNDQDQNELKIDFEPSDFISNEPLPIIW